MKCKIVLLFVLLGVVNYVRASILQSGVPCEDKKIIVDTHNELRAQLATGNVPGQPKAGNLQALAWDDKLEAKAQNYANQMIVKHNPDLMDDRFGLGENLFHAWKLGPDSSATWNDTIQSWFNEYKLYSYTPSYVFDKKIGHYTQMIWADTMYIGCGYTFYEGDDGNHKLYICNYGPLGNVETLKPYELEGDCNPLCCKEQCSKMYGDQC